MGRNSKNKRKEQKRTQSRCADDISPSILVQDHITDNDSDTRPAAQTPARVSQIQEYRLLQARAALLQLLVVARQLQRAQIQSTILARLQEIEDGLCVSPTCNKISSLALSSTARDALSDLQKNSLWAEVDADFERDIKRHSRRGQPCLGISCCTCWACGSAHAAGMPTPCGHRQDADALAEDCTPATDIDDEASHAWWPEVQHPRHFRLAFIESFFGEERGGIPSNREQLRDALLRQIQNSADSERAADDFTAINERIVADECKLMLDDLVAHEAVDKHGYFLTAEDVVRRTRAVASLQRAWRRRLLSSRYTTAAAEPSIENFGIGAEHAINQAHHGALESFRLDAGELEPVDAQTAAIEEEYQDAFSLDPRAEDFIPAPQAAAAAAAAAPPLVPALLPVVDISAISQTLASHTALLTQIAAALSVRADLSPPLQHRDALGCPHDRMLLHKPADSIENAFKHLHDDSQELFTSPSGHGQRGPQRAAYFPHYDCGQRDPQNETFEYDSAVDLPFSAGAG